MPSNKTPSLKKSAAQKKSAAKKAAHKAKAKPKAKAKTKAAPKVKAAPQKVGPRHPRARIAELHGSKAALAKTIAPAIARADEDPDALEVRLQKASNAQLLRLQRATQTMRDKYGDREKLIEAIGKAANKSKDKDYLAKLDSYSLPQLLDLAASSQRAART